MPFIPHTPDDVQAMLAVAGVKKIDDLFDEIPASLQLQAPPDVLPALDEMQLTRLAATRAAQDAGKLCFIGAGAYEHHIPAAVWEVATRGEFMTAYTPYQAEASQGTLQVLYEYQTMMARLLALDVSNASMYDGASALAEAILMAARLDNKKKKTNRCRVLVPETLHPHYRETLKTIVSQQDIELIFLAFDEQTGRTSFAALEKAAAEAITAVVIPQPNFFGVLEEVDTLTDWAHAQGALAIGVVNPLAMALLKPPGEWGMAGVDIACGEGQPLGVPLASGGPYYGFLCCRQAYLRQLPGRIVGRTVDREGRAGFVLTLQAREQHIRRARATSNICTNQGLLVTASTIYMSLLGPEGLRRTALFSHQQTAMLQEKLSKIKGVTVAFATPFFHECVLRFDRSVESVLAQLAQKNIQAGLALKNYYPSLGECLLVCVTETKTMEDIMLFVAAMQEVMHA